MSADGNMIDIVALLGNPGSKYKNTRHNAGWMLLHHLPDCASGSWQKKFKGEFTLCSFGMSSVYLLKPLTYMNVCGESIGAMARFFKVPANRCLIVHDDVELTYGSLGIKKGGGLAGHNGLRSIEKNLGSRDFYRLRIGVGRPLHGSVSSFVLGKFTNEELTHIDTILSEGARILGEMCASDSAYEIATRYADYLVI